MNHPIVVESAGGEYMESVLVVEWNAKPGDPIKAGDVVVVVETAKAASEVEATHSGYLLDILFKPGEEAPVGATLGYIGDERPDAPPSDVRDEVADKEPIVAENHLAAVPRTNRDGRIVATPLARRVARERGVELADVKGTGPRGRIKLRDVDAAEAAASKPRPGKAETMPSRAPSTKRAPVVFIHGFGADSSTWSRMLPLIDTDLERIVIELPGHGGEGLDGAADFDALIAAVLDRLTSMVTGEMHLVGHSLGGAVALALASMARVSIRSLTLIAPGGMGPEINGGFIDGLVRASDPRSLASWLDVMTGSGYDLPHGYAETVLRKWKAQGAQARLGRVADAIFPGGVQSMRLAGMLEHLTMPSKIVWGLEDRVIPVAHAYKAPGLTGVHLLKGVGHVPQIECPDKIARLVNEMARQ
jgi:pimeloyl-ACP methyl ester carboxylesterase